MGNLRHFPQTDESFIPRLAAMAHAGAAAHHASTGSIDEVVAEAANAVACGLVYVGDQIQEARTAEQTVDRREILAVADSLEEMGDDLRAARLRVAVGADVDVLDAEVVDMRTRRERVEEADPDTGRALAELALVVYSGSPWTLPDVLIKEAARRLRAVS